MTIWVVYYRYFFVVEEALTDFAVGLAILATVRGHWAASVGLHGAVFGWALIGSVGVVEDWCASWFAWVGAWEEDGADVSIDYWGSARLQSDDEQDLGMNMCGIHD